MEKYKYAVVDQFGHVLAKDMDIDIALTLLKALMDKWYAERQLLLSVQRVYDEPCSGVCLDDDGEYYGEDC